VSDADEDVGDCDGGDDLDDLDDLAFDSMTDDDAGRFGRRRIAMR
jgi:hypothetical protein